MRVQEQMNYISDAQEQKNYEMFFLRGNFDMNYGYIHIEIFLEMTAKCASLAEFPLFFTQNVLKYRWQ